ncbi:MAG: hypothetical protein ABSE49_09375 [Polyangiaceae bacterium]
MHARSPRWRRTATLLGALLTATGLVGFGTWVGCSIYNPSLLLPAETEGGTSDVMVAEAATPDASDGGIEAAPLACPEVFPPAAPAANDPSDAGDQAFVIALHTLDLGLEYEGGSPPPIGYDLDSIFTCCDGGAESCKAASVGATHCDEPSGRDNSGELLLSSLASLDSAEFNDSTISQRLQAGDYSILIQVLHYNGTPNDTQVTAALYASDGIQPEGDAGVAPPAKWDGTDEWTIDDTFVVSADASPLLPTHFDGNAYVAGGTFVMHVNFPISLGTAGTGSLSISLTSGVITGTLVAGSTPGTYHLQNGLIVGRWNVSSLLGALSTLDLSLNGSTAALCRGTPTYDFVKGLICQHADIMTDPTLDKTGATCDALSIGFSFTADPALMGEVVVPTSSVQLCDGGDDDALAPDNCSTP